MPAGAQVKVEGKHSIPRMALSARILRDADLTRLSPAPISAVVQCYTCSLVTSENLATKISTPLDTPCSWHPLT